MFPGDSIISLLSLFEKNMGPIKGMESHQKFLEDGSKVIRNFLVKVAHHSCFTVSSNDGIRVFPSI